MRDGDGLRMNGMFILMFVCVQLFAYCESVLGQSGSILVQAAQQRGQGATGGSVDDESSPTEMLNSFNDPLHAMSLYTVRQPTPPHWKRNDLVHIIVRETSKIASTQDLTADKKNTITGKINAFPLDGLNHFIQTQAQIGNIDANLNRKFDGSGDYSRDDDFTARITARVIEVLPNGHLVIEARTHIETDDEKATMRLAGIVDPKDVTAAGTILSSEVFDLRLFKDHEGELRKANKRGFLAKLGEAIFGF